MTSKMSAMTNLVLCFVILLAAANVHGLPQQLLGINSGEPHHPASFSNRFVGNRAHLTGFGNGNFAPSEDEFVERLEKLLRSGELQHQNEQQAIIPGEIQPEPVAAAANNPAAENFASQAGLFQRIFEDAAKMNEILHAHPSRIPNLAPINTPTNNFIAESAPNPIGAAPIKETNPDQPRTAPAAAVPKPNEPQNNQQQPMPANNPPPFAYKPSEPEYGHDSINSVNDDGQQTSLIESTIESLEHSADVQPRTMEPSSAVAVEPPRVKYLRELPVPPEYHANYDNQQPELQQQQQQQQQKEQQQREYSSHYYPKRLHPSTFENLPGGASGLAAKIYSTKNGQKEIVTYIDIPKLVEVQAAAKDLTFALPVASQQELGNNQVQQQQQQQQHQQHQQQRQQIQQQQEQLQQNKQVPMESRMGAEVEKQGQQMAGLMSSNNKPKIMLDVGDDQAHWLATAPGKKNSEVDPDDIDAEEQQEVPTAEVEHAVDEPLDEPPKTLKLVQKLSTDEEPTTTDGRDPMSHFYFIGAIAGCSAAVAFGVVAAGIFWMRLKKNAKAAEDTEYPAYGVTGPGKHGGGSQDVSPTSGDRKLAQSAQMYHYQHQKQQMIAMENHGNNSRRHGSTSDVEESDEEENEEGDYTVYECPGLAPTGEMEVRNPLFQDDPITPSSPSKRVTDDYDDDVVMP